MIDQNTIWLFEYKIIKKRKRILNDKNNTPLHYAAEKNRKEIGEILISAGADLHAANIKSTKYRVIFFNYFDLK